MALLQDLQPTASLSEQELYHVAFEILGTIGAVLAGLGCIVGFMLTRYWSNKDRAHEDRAKMRDVLYESLRWFEGGTQDRSIGIAVVNASWASFENFRPIWIEVFSNQAIYLLASSKQGTNAHEHHNLMRLINLLVREWDLLTSDTGGLLLRTIEGKLSGSITTGLTCTDELRADLTMRLGQLERERQRNQVTGATSGPHQGSQGYAGGGAG
jgi:hypothetical protein